MAYGTLKVVVSAASSALPLSDTMITVNGITKTTDENGIVLFENIEAPDVSLSLDPNNTVFPYSTVDIEIQKEVAPCGL